MYKVKCQPGAKKVALKQGNEEMKTISFTQTIEYIACELLNSKFVPVKMLSTIAYIPAIAYIIHI